MAIFPALPNGCITEYPYPETDVYPVAQSYVPSGYTTTYQLSATKKLGFIVTYATLSSAQLATLEAFWKSVGGPLGYFTFTDDSGTSYTTARFDQQEFAVQYAGPGELGVTLRIRVV
jgi:hypothetical protein